MILTNTAVSFIRHVAAIIITIADPTFWDTTTVVTLELVATTSYTQTYLIKGRIDSGRELNEYNHFLRISTDITTAIRQLTAASFLSLMTRQ